MTGTIALTDWNWFQFLSAEPRLDEVNFWRPSARSQTRLEPGTPFLFKLHQEHGGWIVGFGIFAAHSVQPAWMAWEALGRLNGAASMREFLGMLMPIREKKGIPSDPAGNFEIGCIMLSAPVFLPRERWIRPPADWPRSGIMHRRRVDLGIGEGARVWHALLAAQEQPLARETYDGAHQPDRYGTPILVAPRLGQGTFRFLVSDAYGACCAVTREHSLPVLEAAHIRPYSDGGAHEISNGLLLRTDVHRLFDKGYVTIDPAGRRFVVSKRLREDYGNGKSYDEFHGRAIHEPADAHLKPSTDQLEWHARERFLA